MDGGQFKFGLSLKILNKEARDGYIFPGVKEFHDEH